MLPSPHTPHESKTGRVVTSLEKSFVLNPKAALVLPEVWAMVLPDTAAAMVLHRVLTLPYFTMI